MARSPLVAQATRDLAKYFQAITDGTFIDRSWSIDTAQDARSISSRAGGETQIKSAAAIRKIGEENTAGTPEAENIANLINGAVGIGPFFNIDFKEWEEIITHNNYQYAMFDGINNFYVSDESCHLFDRLAFDLTGRFAMQNKESSIQIEAIKNSWAYRIGNLILTPMRAFKGAVKQIINLFIKK